MGYFLKLGSTVGNGCEQDLLLSFDFFDTPFQVSELYFHSSSEDIVDKFLCSFYFSFSYHSSCWSQIAVSCDIVFWAEYVSGDMSANLSSPVCYW